MKNKSKMDSWWDSTSIYAKSETKLKLKDWFLLEEEDDEVTNKRPYQKIKEKRENKK